jgi:SAM-dependent methyltransferase
MKKLNNPKFRTTKCAVCKTVGNYKTVYDRAFKITDLNPDTFLSRKNPKKSHYRMVKCNNCGLLYSNPIVDFKHIKNLYTEAGVPLNEDLENAGNLYMRYLARVLKRLNKNSKILDIGCGNGFVMSLLKKKGFKNVFGVEPSKDSVKHLAPGITKKHMKVGLFGKKLFPKGYFDLICFFQVFDHLTDPNKFLRDAGFNLRKGGYVFALMHDVKSLPQILMGERSPIIDVQHIYLFDKKNIRKIFENNGYEVLDVFTTYSSYSIYYWLKMGPFPGFIKRLAEKNKSFPLLKKTVSLPPGNMAIIARKI